MSLCHSYINASISLDFFGLISLPGAPVGVKIAGVPAPVCDAAPTVEATKEANDDDLDLSRKKLKRKRKPLLNERLRKLHLGRRKKVRSFKDKNSFLELIFS